MPAGTNYRIETAETVAALIIAVDAVITGDATWVVEGSVYFDRNSQVYCQVMKKSS